MTGVDLGRRVNASPALPQQGLVERLAAYDTSDLSDAMRHSRTTLGLASYGPTGGRAAGPAVTVSIPIGGVDTIKLAMSLCRPGDVLVIAARGARHYAAWGGHINEAMSRRGVAGIVVDGCLRDIVEIRDGSIPVLAKGSATAACSLDSAGEVNVPVACAGAVICPGDIVVLDDNGAVAVPVDDAEYVLARAAEIVDLHHSWHPDVDAGRVPGIEDVVARARSRGVDVTTISEVT